MKRDFEKLFSLPWAIQRKGTWEHINSHNGEGLNICIMPYTDFEPKKAARQYLVQCANLMPEAVELLKAADEKLLDLCRTCDNAMSEAGYLVDCKNCNVESLDTNIKELLAKLEGGADDNAPNP